MTLIPNVLALANIPVNLAVPAAFFAFVDEALEAVNADLAAVDAPLLPVPTRALSNNACARETVAAGAAVGCVAAPGEEALALGEGASRGESRTNGEGYGLRGSSTMVKRRVIYLNFLSLSTLNVCISI